MTPAQLSQSIKSAANQIGFGWSGVCRAVAPAGLSRFHEWLDAGYHGEMEYMASRKQAYADPGLVLEGAKSVIMLAIEYKTSEPMTPAAGQGRVSRYAWGHADYHDVIHDRLKQLKARILELHPDGNARGVIDTAPLLERDFAVLAGLGWQGKNTLLLNKHAGSWFFLAAMLVDFELEYDQPNETNHCGTCRACLDACPTNAFVGPNLLDATKCISYLTIELRNPIPLQLRKPMGDRVFGCDVCQDVCPWNSKSNESDVAEFQPANDMNPIDLQELFDLNDEQFRARFRKTPLWRTKRTGILRNAAIALGNQGKESAIPALMKGLNDCEPLIRGAAAWALGEIGGSVAIQELDDRRKIETDPQVIDELNQVP